MKYKVLGLAMLSILLVSCIPFDLDAASNIGGEGHGNGIDVSYSTQGGYFATITLSQRPAEDVTVLITSATEHQDVPQIEAMKSFIIELLPLSIGTHHFIVKYVSTGEIIAECDVEVGYVYTINYSPGEGSGKMTPSQAIQGKGYQLPECTFEAPSGMKFSGWSVDGKQYNAGETIVVNSDITALALWTESEGGISMVIVIIAAVIVLIALIVVILILRRKG